MTAYRCFGCGRPTTDVNDLLFCGQEHPHPVLGDAEGESRSMGPFCPGCLTAHSIATHDVDPIVLH